MWKEFTLNCDNPFDQFILDDEFIQKIIKECSIPINADNKESKLIFEDTPETVKQFGRRR